MSEFLSRGKLKNNGEWIKGIYFPDCKSIISYLEIGSVDISVDLMNCKAVIHKVNPKTVGRYTGLIDKNGKMAFEGDICRFTNYSTSFPCTYIGTIKYSKNIIAIFESGKYCTDLCKWESDDFEVIGNIYDNPELIGGDRSD